MKIAISSRILGTQKHLVNSDERERFQWVSNIPDDAWILDDIPAIRDLRSISEAIGADVFDFLKTPHGSVWREILKNNKEDMIGIPWVDVIPSDQFKRYLLDALDQLWMITRDEIDGYYMNEFVSNRELLLRLKRSAIDKDIIQNLMKDKLISNKSELQKFYSDDGFSPTVNYCQSGSITGRLTIKSGPNILTLKRSNRSIFKSRYPGGRLIQIDIVSLEPRIALSVSESEIPYDIYSWVRDNVLMGEVTRNQAKIATISCLYGMSAWALSKRLPDTIDAQNVLSDVKAYFDIPFLESRLKDQYKRSGFIENFYGRRIKSGDAFVNHYLQSTGVDVSLQSFKWLINRIDEEGISAIPVFVIHDAIILDVESGVDKIADIIKDGIPVPKLNKNFPVTIENIC